MTPRVVGGGCIELNAAKPRGLPLRRPLYGLGPYEFTKMMACIIGYS